MPYPPETLGEDEDDGTMVDNVAELASHVVGHRIVSAEQGSVPDPDWAERRWGRTLDGLILTLDNGIRVMLSDTNDCCAHTSLEKFLLHPGSVDHIITGVGTTEGYTRWHIFADFGDVMQLEVGWSCGNPFYYAYGFDINVIPYIEGESGDAAIEA